MSETADAELDDATTTAESRADSKQLLLDFVRQRDVPCPLCGYNLRDLTLPRCPECRQDLLLTVGVRNLRFVWLVATIAPCIFSGIAAAMLAIPILIAFGRGTDQAPMQVVGLDAFGWLSGVAGLLILRYRFAFLIRSPSTQRNWAIAMWAIHVATFLILLVLAI